MTVWPSLGRACGPRARTLALSAAALCAAALLPSLLSPAGAAASRIVPANVPLPASNYVVEPLCAPPAPGYVSCFSLRVVPVTAAARAHRHPLGRVTRHAVVAGLAAEGAFGLRPQDLHAGYTLPTRASVPQTIAIVDAYDDPTAESDLRAYDTEFHLPECTKANGCFKKVNQAGRESEYPEANSEWDGEISLDIETAHAICQENCHIILVEAERSTFSDLTASEETAVRLGATEISNSWGGVETSLDSSAFNHPGVVITASTGDDGYLNWDTSGASVGHPNYPASSPHVVAVGGTRLALKEESGETKWSNETVWNDGAPGGGNGAAGGGCSEHFTAQLWQQAVPDWSEVGCGSKRASADVAADADPFSGVAVIDNGRWGQVGGTSLASPIIASTFALAGGSGGVNYPAQTLYSHLGEGSLHDVVSGSNGRCTHAYNFETGTSGCTTQEESEQCLEELICTAAPGYDGPSGVGTPDGVGAFAPPPPTVTSISPAEGSIAGGTVVKVSGTDLLGASAVDFGASAGQIQADSATEITVKAPSHAEGKVDVTVTTGGGTSGTSPADEYDYVVPPAPTIASVSPAEGSTTGGTTVKITGANLEGATAVEFEGAPAEIKTDSQTEITVATPAHAEGTVDVTVTTAGGTSATGPADEFTYVVPPPPTVTRVQPSEGIASGGTTVKITGTNFQGATAVDFGETAGTSLNVVSATEILVRSPGHAAGTVDVTVITPGGTSATSAADHFTFAVPTPIEPASNGGGSGVNLTTNPVATSSAGGGSSGPSVSPSANSNFNVLGEQVNGNGSVRLTIAVFNPGSLHWLLTFASGCPRRRSRKGGCRATSGVFGEGSRGVTSARVVTLTIGPGGAAAKALRLARTRGTAVAVTAHLSYTATGGTAIAHTASLSVRLKSARRKHRR